MIRETSQPYKGFCFYIYKKTALRLCVTIHKICHFRDETFFPGNLLEWY